MARKYNPARDPRGQSIAWYNYDEGGYRYFEKDSPSFSRFNQYGNQTLLDDSRNWRTKYYTDGGFGHNIAAGNNMEKDGRLFTGKSRTKLIDDDGWITGEQLGHSHKEYEILDWDAYNRDNIYGSALEKRHGRRKFESVQDILDAEEVMSGTWKATPPPPPEPKPPQPSLQPKHIDLSKYISKDQLAQYQSEWQTQAQNQYQSDLAAQKAEMAAYAADQLAQTKSSLSDQYAHALKQAESDWATEFDLAKNQWAETAAKEQQDIRSSLLDDFKTERAAQDRVYDSQISELRNMYLGKESGWQDTLNTYETALATQKSAWDSQIGDYKSAISDYQSTIGDYKTQISGFQDLISGQQATIGEIEKARAEQSGQLKVYQEQAMRDAERARVAATYGKSGKPMNQDVKGVKTLNELPSDRPKFRSSFFNRGGSRIKNTSLNIA